MIDGRDVRHDPQREHREGLERSPAEEVEQPDETRRLRLIREGLHLVEIDTRRRDRGPEPIDAEDEQRVQDLVPEVPDPEHVAVDGKHVVRGSVT